VVGCGARSVHGFCRVRASNIGLWLGAVLVLYHGFCRVRVSTIGLWLGAVLVFEQRFALEDGIGSHACSLEALACMQPMEFLSGVHSSYRVAL
jgi:hypothetical protein